jgi:hypothetical protein
LDLKEEHIMKKGQGLPINTIIIAALAMIVLVILFAILTGRFALVNQTLNECRSPARCIGEYTTGGQNGLPAAVQDLACDPSFETPQPGTFVKQGQTASTAVDELVRCSKCCLRT